VLSSSSDPAKGGLARIGVYLFSATWLTPPKASDQHRITHHASRTTAMLMIRA
jgi:hypothetical protein